STTCLVFSSPFAIWCYENLGLKCGNLFTSYSLFHDDDKNCVVKDFDLDTPLSKVDVTYAMRSHCNGIICIASPQTILLCNPAIKECRTLPKTCLCLADDGFVRLGMGFNHDSKANDYKFVRFGYDTRLRNEMGNFVKRAEIYSMRKDAWREIGIDLNFVGLPSRHTQFFCKGVFYWFMETCEYFIVSFNMFDEVFRSIPLPNNFHVIRKDHRTKLALWNASVALFLCHCERQFTDTIEVWVMDNCSSDVQGSCSWRKTLIIGPLVDIGAPLIFLKNDEILMKASDGSLILYNPRTQRHTKITSIQAANGNPHCEFSYVQSLVSVQGGSRYHS
ncbi:F-box associated domain, type, partial [Trema orientale]